MDMAASYGLPLAIFRSIAGKKGALGCPLLFGATACARRRDCLLSIARGRVRISVDMEDYGRT